MSMKHPAEFRSIKNPHFGFFGKTKKLPSLRAVEIQFGKSEVAYLFL